MRLALALFLIAADVSERLEAFIRRYRTERGGGRSGHEVYTPRAGAGRRRLT
jgi:hypothetical protein